MNGIKVTDSTLLKKLNSPSPPAAKDGKVTDPDLLAKLNGNDAPAGPKGLEDRLRGQTPSTNLERDGKPVYVDGAGYNVASGINDMLAKGAGYLVDAPRNAINDAIIATNAVTGKPLTSNTIRDDGFGSSKWWTGVLSKFGVHDPDHVIASSVADKVARAAGEGIAMTVAPDAIVSVLGKAGVIGPKAVQIAKQFVGDSKNLGELGANAFAGGAAGAGAAGGEEIAPEPLKPLVSTVGALAGGGIGALAATAPEAIAPAARAVSEGVARYLEPIGLTKARLGTESQQRAAGRQLLEASSDPAQFRQVLDTAPTSIVDGAPLTTFQASGDLGIGMREKGVMQKDQTGAFAQRRADQNTAHVAALKGLQTSGSAEAVADALRARLRSIESDADATTTASAQTATTRTAALGEGQTPELAGAAMSQGYEAARAAAKAKERALWTAVDPTGTLVLPTATTRQRATAMLREIPKSAKAPEGEEAAIYDIAKGYGPSVPLSEMQALRSRVSEAMRAERRASGETPAWRRLSMMRTSIENDLSAGIAAKISAEDATPGARDVGSIRFRLASPTAPATGDQVFTPAGRAVDVGYRVVEAPDLITSHTPDLQPNPAYDQAMQPRNRSRAASELQISKMASELQPERLGASTSAAEGAPIVGPDGMVESGNGRVLALRRAYAQNGPPAERYRSWLANQGHDVTGMAEPVLIRERTSPLDRQGRIDFAREANASPVMSMSAGERSAGDAARLDGDVLGQYRGGDVGSPENRDFVRSFIGKVAAPGEEAALTTADGRLSLDGSQRIRNALLRAAYDDAPLVSALTETGDENITALGASLGRLSGDVARLRQGIKDGLVHPEADVSPSLVEAAKFVQQARARGVSVEHALAQREAFNPLSRQAFAWLHAGFGDGLKGRFSQARFDELAKDVIQEAEQQSTSARLFGEPMSAAQIIEGAVARHGQGTGAGESYSARPDRSGQGEVRPEGRGPVDGSRGSSRAAGSAAGTGQVIHAEPNFTEAAYGRLRTATEATKQRVATFDNSTLRPIRQRDGGLPAGAIPAKIFHAGARGFEDVQAFRRAVGDGPALKAVEDYAVNRLRQVALRDDGTINPVKLASWRQGHADALRALPDLDARLVDAGKAATTMADVAARGRDAIKDAQIGTLGKLIGVDHPDDVESLVGSIFGKQTSVREMRQLRNALGDNREALEGLRKTIADYMAKRFTSITEAATSGTGVVKRDAFQTFVSDNRATLEAAGFGDNELRMMERIAESLGRINRSVAGVKHPGDSGTFQNFIASKLADTSPVTIFAKVGAAALAAGGAGLLANPAVAATAGLMAPVVVILRQHGLRKVEDLVREALLDPALARMLVMKVPAERERVSELGVNIGRRLGRSIGVGALVAEGEKNSGAKRSAGG